jgi:uncharacterized membrane protein YdjX (TVP38/TMEM64 family)
LLVVAIGALAGTAYALPVHHLTSTAAGLGPAGAVALGTLLLLALVPRTAISLACGALFGALPGFGYALSAALASAALAFVAARFLARDTVRERISGRAARLDGWLRRRGLLAVVLVRLIPIAPYGLVSYAYGASAVRARHYLAGTLIGAAPSAASYAGIGAAALAPGRFNLLTLAPAAAGVLISVAAVLWWRHTSGAPRTVEPAVDQRADAQRR